MSRKYGRLTIKNCFTKDGVIRATCLCDCGKIKEIRLNDLRTKKTTSCGCLHKENLKKRLTTHGLSHTNFHEIWAQLRKRCLNIKNKSYELYGARGVRICNRWLKFENFRDDMYDSYLEHKKNNKYTSVERIDNNGDYCPQNCKWADRIVQANNRRNNLRIFFMGKEKTIAEWGKYFDIKIMSSFYERSKRLPFAQAIMKGL